MRPIGCPETSVTNDQCCLTSKKNEDILAKFCLSRMTLCRSVTAEDMHVGLQKKLTHITFFCVLLDLYPNIMTVFFYQLDAQILYINTFITFLYMFRALLCSSSGVNKKKHTLCLPDFNQKKWLHDIS